jgi:hypothetical protein
MSEQLEQGQWVPSTIQECEALLETLMNDDAEILKLEAMLSAYKDNIKAAINEIRRRRESYEYVYGPAILNVLEQSGKDRHKSPFGTIAKLQTKGTIRVADKELAAEILAHAQPQAVLTEPKILVSLFDESWREQLLNMDEADALNTFGLAIEKPTTKAAFYTNVKSPEGGT